MNFIIYRKNNLIFIMNFIYKNLNFKFYCYQNVLFITNGPAAAWHRNKDLFGLCYLVFMIMCQRKLNLKYLNDQTKILQ